jgi:hypothetical protein
MITGSADRVFPRLAVDARIGDYIIEGDLASRGVADQCYRAAHVMLPRKARLVLYGSSRTTAHLMREACVLERMRHQGVPRVFECGIDHGRAWLATELPEGTSLEQRLLDGRLPVLELLAVVRDIADVLEHAHQRGVVHRNVAVETIVCGPSGAMLFGWADTCSRALVSTRADVLALGVVADRALAREAPTSSLEERARSSVRLLIDRMLIDEPCERPTSAEVRIEANQLIEQFDVTSPEPEVAYRVVLSGSVFSPSRQTRRGVDEFVFGTPLGE